MTRLVVAALALIVLFGSSALAQDATSKVEVFGGYSLLHADNGGLTGPTLDSALGQPSGTFGMPTNFNGWNAEVQVNVRGRLGVVADFASHTGQALTSSNIYLLQLPSSNDYSLLFGPVLSYKVGRISPFVHALAGLDRFHLGAGSIPGLFGRAAPVVDRALAFAVGGGIDYKLSRHLSLRPVQADFFYTGHDLNAIYAASYTPGLLPNLASHENNLRFAAGIVIKF